jgi:aldose 1-epimerase
VTYAYHTPGSWGDTTLSKEDAMKGRIRHLSCGFCVTVAVISCLFLCGGCMVSGSGTTQRIEVRPAVIVSPFGVTAGGVEVEEYTLSNSSGMRASVITFGGILRELWVPAKDGRERDVVLGFDSLRPYEERHPWFGTITGRFANRIARGQFTLDGVSYHLAVNNGPNHLHGGVNGFDRAVWKAQPEQTAEYARVVLSHLSPDGDEGYPGEVWVQVSYTLTNDNELRIDYKATASKPTPINLTNHSYFNLAGHAAGDVLSHRLVMHADRIVEVDETQIPTGELPAVKGSAFDFTTSRTLGERIREVGIGYDHTYVIKGEGGELRSAAELSESTSGIRLEVLTTEPGVQLYTGNYLDGTLRGKGGAQYKQHQGVCLEAQHFPDSVNQPSFPSTILRPGRTYAQTTVLRFHCG